MTHKDTEEHQITGEICFKNSKNSSVITVIAITIIVAIIIVVAAAVNVAQYL